jgi:N-acetylmuramoyl-L-alanine amidase CwlD
LTTSNGIQSFTIKSKKTVLPGNYKISVWIKKPGTRGIYKNSAGLGYYDSYYCISGYAGPIKIKSAAVSANILSDGTSPVLKITSAGYGMAQYDIFLYSNSAGRWVDISNGYTTPASVNTIYNFKLSSINKTGSYKISVLVKTAGSPGITAGQGGLGYYDSKYDASFNVTFLPKITSVKINNSPLSDKVIPNMTIASSGSGKVQYRVLANLSGTSTWEDVTGGYTGETNAAIPFTLNLNRKLSTGTYRLSVWVKRAGTNGVYSNSAGLGSYDGYYCKQVAVSQGVSDNLPKITSVTVNNNPLSDDVIPSLTVASSGSSKVQYRVLANLSGTSTWEDVTGGYTGETDAAVPFTLNLNRKLSTSTYRLSVWVKMAGTNGVYSNSAGLGSYDGYYCKQVVVTQGIPDNLPKITSVTVNNNPLTDDVIPSLTVASSGSGKVQYRVLANLSGTSNWEDVTGGYTGETDAGIPFTLNLNKKLSTGTYKLSVWVKVAGTNGTNTDPTGLGNYDGCYCISQNVISHSSSCIIIDAGHGGNDSGAVGPTGLYEKDVTLNIALKVGEILKNNNINVIYTRESDSTSWDSSNQMDSLETRVNISNSNSALAFVAIHCNSCGDPSVNGIETYVYAKNTPAEKLADNIQSNLVQETSLSDRGVRTNDYYVLVHTTSPAVLTEIGFISNPDEENSMRNDDYLNKVADAIANGIISFVNSSK